MTSLRLLLWITSAIFIQLAVFLAIAFWRHWRDYLALREGVAEVVPARPVPPLGGEAAAAWTGFRPFRVTRKILEDGAKTVCSFYFEPEDGKALLPFLPGQFLTFRLDVPAADGGTEQIVRCYSLSDAPRAEGYRVSIKRVPAPPGKEVPPGLSSNFFHDHIEVGSTLQVRAPSGHFHIDQGDAPVVLVGGGIGITPMLSMLNWSLANQAGREIWLYYGVRNSREVVMREHLAALAGKYSNFHLRLCFSDPLPEDQPARDYQHKGRVDVALFRMELPLKPYHFYICGPGPMMQGLVSALEDWGVPDARIHFEAFGPSTVKRKAAPATQEPIAEVTEAAPEIMVTFAKSGKQFPWQPGTACLLEFAEAHGIAVDFGCRAGSCGTCQTAIRSGEVMYRQPPDFDPEPGNCLLCVCTPKTSVTLEA